MAPHSEGFAEAKHPRNIVTKPPGIAPLAFSTIIFHRWLCLKLHNLCLGKKDFCFLPYPTNLRYRHRGLVLLTRQCLLSQTPNSFFINSFLQIRILMFYVIRTKRNFPLPLCFPFKLACMIQRMLTKDIVLIYQSSTLLEI